MKIFTLTTEGDNCPMETRAFATEKQAYAALRADLSEFAHSGIPDELLTELWEKEFDGPACVEQHDISAPSPQSAEDAILLLVQAIEDIQHNWESGDLAEMVRNAIAVKDEICQQFDLRSTAQVEADNAGE